MDYTETRRHELRKRRLLMVDGNLTLNAQTTDAGASARIYRGGYWGFAATNDTSAASLDRLTAQAGQNAKAMARFGAKDTRPLPGGSYRGEHVFRGRAAIGQQECVARMAALAAWCKQRYPDLVSTRILLQDEHHSKWVTTSNGSEVLNSIQRAACGVFLTAIGDDGAPVELYEPLSCKGSLADLDLSVDALAGWLDELHTHLQAKRHAVRRAAASTPSCSPPISPASSRMRRWGTPAKRTSCWAALSRATWWASASPATWSRWSTLRTRTTARK